MKKNYLWGICAVMALSSCSQDEVVSVPQTGISYSVVTDKASRAQEVFCNNTKPDHFYVSAVVDNKAYFTKDLLNKDGNEYKQDASRYWPEEGKLDFYAYANGNKVDGTPAEVNFSLADKKITEYEVGTTVADQKDLIYAVQVQQQKPENENTKVKLNFRHALSQIVFQAWNKNPNIYVEISGVEIHNVSNKGDFTFPIKATDGNIVDHDQNGEDGNPDAPDTDTDITIANQGTWGLKTTTADYAVSFGAIAVKYNEGKVSLTNNVVFESDNDLTDKINEAFYKDRAMLLLPQTTNAFVIPATWSKDALEAEGAGAFFYVKCKIWNVASSDGIVNKDTDVLVYSGKDEDENDVAKEILIPVEIAWNQGHKYVYTFIFDKHGNGGTDPDDGDPVLIPITYEITVDDFTNETEIEVEMNAPKSNN